LYKTQGGTDAGDIDLSASPSTPELTLIDCDLKTDTNGTNLILGATIVTELGAVNFGTITGTGFDNKFNTNKFQYKGIELDFSGDTRQVKLLTTTDDEQISIFPTDSGLLADGSNIKLNADLFGAGSDIDILAGTGTNPGDINLTTKAGQEVKINTGDLNIGANITSDVKISTVGKGIFVKEGTNATSGSDTLVAGVKTVSTTACTTSSRIIISRNHTTGTGGETLGILLVTAIANGSFTVTSLQEGSLNPSTRTGDTTSFYWLIIEPA